VVILKVENMLFGLERGWIVSCESLNFNYVLIAIIYHFQSLVTNAGIHCALSLKTTRLFVHNVLSHCIQVLYVQFCELGELARASPSLPIRGGANLSQQKTLQERYLVRPTNRTAGRKTRAYVKQ
jgi:hypothetical protein